MPDTLTVTDWETLTWEGVRTLYPDQWVVVEALDGKTKGDRRVFSALELIGHYDDRWPEAWSAYKAIHHANKQREYYVLHTAQETLNIGVIDSFGRILSE